MNDTMSDHSSAISGLTTLGDTTDPFYQKIAQYTRDEARMRDATDIPFKRARQQPRIALTLENLEKANAKFDGEDSSTEAVKTVNKSSIPIPSNIPKQWGRKSRMQRNDYLKRLKSDSDASPDKPAADSTSAQPAFSNQAIRRRSPIFDSRIPFPVKTNSPRSLKPNRFPRTSASDESIGSYKADSITDPHTDSIEFVHGVDYEDSSSPSEKQSLKAQQRSQSLNKMTPKAYEQRKPSWLKTGMDQGSTDNALPVARENTNTVLAREMEAAKDQSSGTNRTTGFEERGTATDHLDEDDVLDEHDSTDDQVIIRRFEPLKAQDKAVNRSGTLGSRQSTGAGEIGNFGEHHVTASGTSGLKPLAEDTTDLNNDEQTPGTIGQSAQGHYKDDPDNVAVFPKAAFATTHKDKCDTRTLDDQDTLDLIANVSTPLRPSSSPKDFRAKERATLKSMAQHLRQIRAGLRSSSTNLKKVEQSIEKDKSGDASTTSLESKADSGSVAPTLFAVLGATASACNKHIWSKKPSGRAGLTWLGIFLLAVVVWLVLELSLCQVYCHKLYAYDMEGYGVDIYAPRKPWVAATILFFRPIARLFSGL